jgi:hypothetical protein
VALLAAVIVGRNDLEESREAAGRSLGGTARRRRPRGRTRGMGKHTHSASNYDDLHLLFEYMMSAMEYSIAEGGSNLR